MGATPAGAAAVRSARARLRAGALENSGNNGIGKCTRDAASALQRVSSPPARLSATDSTTTDVTTAATKPITFSSQMSPVVPAITTPSPLVRGKRAINAPKTLVTARFPGYSA